MYSHNKPDKPIPDKIVIKNGNITTKPQPTTSTLETKIKDLDSVQEHTIDLFIKITEQLLQHREEIEYLRNQSVYANRRFTILALIIVCMIIFKIF